MGAHEERKNEELACVRRSGARSLFAIPLARTSPCSSSSDLSPPCRRSAIEEEELWLATLTARGPTGGDEAALSPAYQFTLLPLLPPRPSYFGMGNIKKLFIPTPLNEREDLEASATSPLLPAAAALSAPPPRAKNNYIRPFLLLCGTAAAVVLVGGFCKGSVSGGRRGEGDGGAWPTFVGFEGPTPTGSEALAAATAYPSNSDYYPLRPPSSFPAAANSSTFDVLDNLGNLSPWRSVNHGLAGTGQVPKGCTVEQVRERR